MERFNDVIADPAGRVYAGTIGKTRDSGGLYRVDLDGSVTKLFSGTGCANGMGFTPDRQHFYWTCSTTKRILRFAYNEASGELRRRTTFFEADKSDSTPDGLAVDSTGTVWSARYGGHGIIRHDTASGQVAGKLELPVPNVTSLFFGGANRSTMYVTTAGGKDGSTSADGTLYAVASPVSGLPEFVSRIRF
jgi:D-xylonolactonase